MTVRARRASKNVDRAYLVVNFSELAQTDPTVFPEVIVELQAWPPDATPAPEDTPTYRTMLVDTFANSGYVLTGISRSGTSGRLDIMVETHSPIAASDWYVAVIPDGLQHGGEGEQFSNRILASKTTIVA